MFKNSASDYIGKLYCVLSAREGEGAGRGLSTVASWPIVGPHKSKRDKSAAEFWLILNKKGRKWAELLKHYFTYPLLF